MSIDLSAPVVIDLDRGTIEAAEERCDLCGRPAELFRLLRTEHALCEGCFVAWHV